MDSRGRRHHGSKQKVAPVFPDVNVTPLIDVVLVLLIIFMVVTPMLARGVAVEMPRTKHHDKKADTGEQIIVAVSKEGRIWLDKTPMKDHDQLAQSLAEILRRSPGRDVYVRGDHRIKYKTAREVLEAVHRAGGIGAALGTDEEK
jgi:biopolymer transport protein ExbD/biopolymer transport protein TolR